MYKRLRDFIEALRGAGELKVVPHPVSAHLEISKITDGESKSPGGGKALYFERVKGSSFPAATNIFGSPKRICMALGVDHLDQLAERVRRYIELNPPRNLREALNTLPLAIQTTRFFPRRWRSGTPPCQAVVWRGDQIDLTKLPVLHCWPQDAGPFITLPLVITRSLETGKRNMGMYRMQVFDRNTTGMHWHIHKDGSHYFNEYVRAGKRMPVAVAIGADPATTYAATAPMPRGMDEILLAGFIRKQPVAMARCLTVDLEVPAEAEFVLEGYVNPDELRREGPFGDHTGYYSLADDYPVFHVTALTHRPQPIYSATLVGRPPMEDCYLAKATERLFLPMLQAVMPEIQDYWFPWEGVFHNIVILSIDKEFAGHAQKIMSGLWGQGQMSFCKAIVVVDRGVNPQNPGAVVDKLLSQLDLTTDITVTKGVLDVLDHSSPYPNFGNKIGLDLTERFRGEPPRSVPATLPPVPAQNKLLADLKSLIPAAVDCRHLFKGLASSIAARHRLLAVAVERSGIMDMAQTARKLLEAPPLAMFTVLLLFDRQINLADGSLLLWKVFNNVDPGRDLILHQGRMLVNACKKGPLDGHTREWPDELSFD